MKFSLRDHRGLIITLGTTFLVVSVGLLYLLATIPGRSAVSPNAPYRDSSLPVANRVEDLLARMTLQEKIGQMALVDKNSVHFKADIARYGLGALLSGGGAKPTVNTPKGWLEMVDDFQDYATGSRLGIPLLYGVDAVHGHTNVPGATIFPQSIGLGASGDADLVRRIGAITAQEVAATGINWNFGPSLDVVRDTRWGRTYETYGSSTATVSQLGAAFLNGMQSTAPAVIGTAKHYLGTGAMTWGTSGNPDFKIDQGVTYADEATLRAVHLPPFSAAVEAGVGSVMVGHTTWNGMELAANHYLLTDVLKGELGFKGFVVSDWYGVYEIPGGEYQAVVTAVNAGVDMVMLPYDYKSFSGYLEQAVTNGDVTVERLDDAVRRILTVKLAAGLFDQEKAKPSGLDELGSAPHRAVAREAVRKSLVILKDDQLILPLRKDEKRILVAGSSADNLGRQSGGWTVEWQGIDGNWIPGTTILQAIKNAVAPNTTVEFSELGNFVIGNPVADVGIAVVGEAPYAEGWGDDEHPALSNEDLQTIAKVKAASKKIVVIIISGRPLDVAPYIDQWDAVVAAWLPGSEGAGVTDVLFGDYQFTGILPVHWPL